MKRVFKLLFNHWTLVFLGLVAAGLLIWFVGPLVAIAEYHPLESSTVRLFIIALAIILYAGKHVWRVIKAKTLNARLMDGLLWHPSPPPQPGDSAGAEEVVVLRKRFEEAVTVLKQANLGGQPRKPLLALLTRQQYVYELPWYIFIGPPGSGKTTALVNSGLQFPFAERFGQEVIRGIGGTRNCDWWFTNEAVLLDTAGRYTTQESNREADSAAWTGFLQLLKKYRPRRPINGVIVTVSVTDLLQQTVAQREAQATAIRKRIQELHAELNIRFPLYVLVTKADLLAGFMDFFGEYGREERAQVWGATFPLTEKQDTLPLANFSTEFSALEQRLNDRLIDRLQQERDAQKRALLYAFPQQFSSLKEVLGDFLNQIFSPSRFEQQPLLRGFYFTSGTQEGNPIDRVMGTLARALHLDRKLLAPNKPSGKSFFLTRLVKDVIFSEAGLAGTNLRWERRRAWLQWGAFATAGLITLGAITAWTVSYSRNQAYLAEAREKIPAILQQVEELPVLQSMDIVSLLPVLKSVRDLSSASPGNDDTVPLSMGFGLYQGDKLAAASNNTYQRLLHDAFLPQLVLRIERLLSGGGRANLDLLYEGLKAYLMLSNPEHFDPVALKAFITADWEVSLPREITIEQRDELESHLDHLLSRGPLSSPIPLNEQLIANVRYTVAQTPIAQRSYNRLKLQGVGAEIPEFTIVRAAGPSAPLIFARISGQPLTQGVPGLFSYDGYYKFFFQAAKEVTGQLADEEVWVLGLKEKDRNKWTNPQAQVRLVDEVRRLYLEDYAQIWSAFIDDIGLLRSDSLPKSIQSARLLSAPDSPLTSLIRGIVKEVTLIDVDEADKTVADKAVDKVKTARDKLEILIGKTGKKTSITAFESRPERIVDDRFKELRSMVRPAAPGQPAPIDAIPSQINELYILLTATEAAVKGGGAPPPSDVPSKIKADAGRMPEPIRSMLVTLSTSGISQALGETRANLNQSLKATISDFCHKAIDGRYPFEKNSARDVTQDDFARLFAPGGLLDEFFQKNLTPYVDTSTRPWSFRKAGDASMGHASGALQEFRRAQIIRDVFFRSGGRAAGMKLVFKPIEMDASITQFILDVDGQLVKYSHGPQVPMELQWPGPRGSSQVRLQISPASASGASGQIFEGPWALFRMLDGVQITPTSQPEKFVVTFSIDGRKARFEVITSSVQNPFRLHELEQFQCPERL
ncbi:type VI secretion system protein ImpL [Nitrosospira sp. Nsp5]|uniref:Type VI secretion system protein ImpL n=1 Tax=Nitrosospira multiformis TaxID=1231 RepID=A0ABY0TDX2_9PROT|nr:MULTISPECIES: type VI secretion system membrane subunit TssM [Nitrosospira]PTR08988.1 type VI secretion system protein ImpL [Nitrosospira sp. Nsp5]SDQ68460.1 type VI secretion system protein ImpL [Nitrosospira multiformis]